MEKVKRTHSKHTILTKRFLSFSSSLSLCIYLFPCARLCRSFIGIVALCAFSKLWVSLWNMIFSLWISVKCSQRLDHQIDQYKCQNWLTTRHFNYKPWNGANIAHCYLDARALANSFLFFFQKFIWFIEICKELRGRSC